MDNSRAAQFMLFAALAACSTSAPPSADSARRLIGSSGGTLELGASVTLSVPPGALTDDQTITITRTGEAAPAGYVAYSPIYRFEPRGIEFAVPITVTIGFDGDASRARMVWTTRSTNWEGVEGAVAGMRVSAQISHFSGGFVGAEDVDGGSDPVDAGSVDGGSDDGDVELDGATVDTGETVEDGGSVDTGAEDGGTADTGGGAFCPTPRVIPADMATTGFVWEVTEPTEVDPCYAACPPGPGRPAMRSAAAVTLTAPMQATLWYSHTLATEEWRATISGECGDAGAICRTIPAATYPYMRSVLLEPGTYQFVSCNRTPAVVIEPPPPAPTNTSCATAGTFTSTPYRQRRVTTADALYYAFDWSGFGAPGVGVRSTMNQGQMHLSLRDSCDHQVASYDVPYVLAGTGTTAFIMTSRPAGRYYVVATEISQGLEYDVLFN